MADTKRDYYEVLGLAKGASDAEIKKAYHGLVKKYHPDLHPGDKEAERIFKEVNEAYSILSDPEKKKKYDTYGHAAFDPAAGGGFGGGTGGFGGFGDIFETFFGGGFGGGSTQSRNGVTRGDDLEARVSISFEEAAFGCKREINYNRIEKCPDCHGSGAGEGSSVETCGTCHGSGQVRTTQRTILGMMQSTGPCPTCNGRGKIIKKPCGNCRGTGYVRIRKRSEVSIPAGIDNGQRVILRGQGDEGRGGGPAGDLYLTISVSRHDIFERDGNTLFCEVPITFAEAALGGEISVPTLQGTVNYRIPEGTQTGTRFTLRGKGLPTVNSSRMGDLVFTVVVETPRNLTGEQKELLSRFSGEAASSKYSRHQQFMNNLNRLFNRKNKDK